MKKDDKAKSKKGNILISIQKGCKNKYIKVINVLNNEIKAFDVMFGSKL